MLEESLHYALSRDGRTFTALAGNTPVWQATVDGQSVPLRDPFVARGLDGRYHLLATRAVPAQRQPDGRYHRIGMGFAPHSGPADLLHATSDDLITWQDVSIAPVLRDVPAAKNLWAPEFVPDAQHGDHLVIWSSSVGPKMWWDKAIWCARTRDFVTYTAPRVLFDPNLNVIDAHIVPHADGYYLFYKPDSHDDTKHVNVAVSANLDGPYETVTVGATPTITEGPHVVWRDDLHEWWMYYDHPWEKRYGLSTSKDLRSWTPLEGGSFPEDARHASVLRLTEEEYERLARAWA